jgi:hypothetical protein
MLRGSRREIAGETPSATIETPYRGLAPVAQSRTPDVADMKRRRRAVSVLLAYEVAFRRHLVRHAARGELRDEIVDIGRWWRDAPPVEIDAVALAGRSRRPVLVGEAKWTRDVDGSRLRRALERKADALPDADANRLRYSICARERITRADDLLLVTAADIFDPDA